MSLLEEGEEEDSVWVFNSLLWGKIPGIVRIFVRWYSKKHKMLGLDTCISVDSMTDQTNGFIFVEMCVLIFFVYRASQFQLLNRLAEGERAYRIYVNRFFVCLLKVLFCSYSWRELVCGNNSLLWLSLNNSDDLGVPTTSYITVKG